MKRLDFNTGWTCKYLPSRREEPVTLPHDAMRTAQRSEKSKGEANIGWFESGDAEYSKTFDIPTEYIGKRVVVEFEGVYHDAKVAVNGYEVGTHSYGYTGFNFDITKYLHFGDKNVIKVLAKNSDQPNSRWYTGTGIYRPCYLYVGDTESICLDGIKVRTVRLDPAILEVDVQVWGNEGEVSIEVLEASEHRPIIRAKSRVHDGLATFRLSIGNAKLWSPATPNLYEIKARYNADEVMDTFGIRIVGWSAEEGFTINGERVILRGACIHHDNGILGACAFPEAEERKVRILNECGYNAIRSAHNPCSKALLAACDKLGMLVMDEYVDVWYIHKTQYDYATLVERNYRVDLADMVKKDYNHPCVVMYSTGNEVSETAQKKGIELTGEMTKYLHEIDPTRPVTCGINIFFNFLSSIGLGVYTDDKAKAQAAQAAQSGEAKKAKKKAVGSEFYNTLATTFGDYTMKKGATFFMCDLKTKDAYANMDIAGYNYGIFRYQHDLKKYPKRLILGSETFPKDAYDFMEIAKKEKRIIGDFVWTGIDYIGETGEGAAEYSDYKLPEPWARMTGGNGRIDLLGKPRAEARYMQVAYGLESGPFLSVKPVYEREKLRLTGWQLSKGIESWSFRGNAGKVTDVEVYAQGVDAEIQVNGKTVGRKTLKKCRAMFKVPYEDGWITAISYDAEGKEIARNTLKTAGERTNLEIHYEKRKLAPGELGFVFLQYTDMGSTWKPMERHRLKVEVENGELVALGSANPYVDGNFADNVCNTYFGEAMAVIRPFEKGNARILVSDEYRTYSKIIPVM